jgi:phosphoribosylformylglycinamidine synthase
MGRDIPVVHLDERPDADEVNLDIPDEELLRLGKEGIPDADGSRRGPLALDMASLEVIKDYFKNKEERNPTDVELESIAQTWSEHCKHTIFAAKIDDIDEGIFKAYIREATMRIRREKGSKDFCLSIFSDNSGGIEFDDQYLISDKVETHNSPSALDPFGGAITGIVGVNRDTIGFGMGARPIANRYGFCFADPNDDTPLFRDKSAESRLLPPRRIMEGVIHGVNVGGNCSGIPTPQGFVYFDERYKGKPLVFVGTVGIMPKVRDGKQLYQKKAMPGDYIVIVGGRVGKDGIHGATFSSEALSSGSPATAVQIGDPITQKKLSDAIVKEARDRGLYHSITDNGAGGLSCSVAEMAREAGGFEVDLDKVPLKYAGLAPWQIWVSESQERMTVSVPEETLEDFISLMRRRGVEATVIGKFTASGRGMVRYVGKKVFDLDLAFLHDGLPKKIIATKTSLPKVDYEPFEEPVDCTEYLLAILRRPNIASFEFISMQYDHEVQANSVIKPLQGKGRVNGSATVIRPVYTSYRGVVLSQGLYPSYSDIDCYWMAACSIDTAVRNAVAAGGTLERLAILDNFCWCDSTNPERLAQLKEAARACYDFAVAYGTPFISGKDSMFNDFRGFDDVGNEIVVSIPPTLLISSIGVVMDVRNCQTIDFKFPGDIIYLIGTTSAELGGSEYLAYMGEKIRGKKYIGENVPRVDAKRNIEAYRALEAAISERLIASCISVERGGLAVALAKSAMAGILGCEVELSMGRYRTDDVLFSESQGRLLVSVAPSKKEAFESVMKSVPCLCVGTVCDDERFRIAIGGKYAVETDVYALQKSYRERFKGF